MNDPKSAPDRAADAISDPARDDQTGSDWATEGGATPAGPATEVDAQDGPQDKPQDGPQAD